MVAAELGLRAEKQQAASLQKELGLWGRLSVDEFEPCVREVSLIRDIPAKRWKNLWPKDPGRAQVTPTICTR